MYGYIEKYSKEEILKKYTQEQIFLIVFDEIDFNKKYKNPLRKDKNPSCFFKYKNDKLIFYDFAVNDKKNNIYLSNLDCFSFIRFFFNLKDFDSTLNFIVNNIEKKIKGKKVLNLKKNYQTKIKIYPKIRDFLIADKNYWFKKYGIDKSHLIEDGVYPISEYFLNDKFYKVKKLSYIYTEFYPEYKIYAPYSKFKKWISTVKKDKIGNIKNLKSTDNLIITKSYKDFRVLFNHLEIDIIWFMSENIIPNNLELVKNYKKIFIIYDNDLPGIKGSENLSKYLKNFLNKDSLQIKVPKNKGTDISDLYYFNKKNFYNFIKNIKKSL